jgi:homoserine kinase
VVGGLAAANAFLGDMYSKEELLPFAIELEHGQNPDNVAPALFGGLVVVGAQQGGVVHAKVPFPSDIRAVYFIPDFEMSTVEGRKLMPAQYHKADVVFNTSRIALFMAALQTKRYELLQQAMDDKLHQPTRTRIFPAMPHIIQAANQAGALGAALSGGGSTIIALANQDFEHIAQAMKAEAAKHGVAGTTKVLEIVDEGVRVDND